MNPLRLVVEHLADHLHADADAEARAWGMEVTRLPDGRRIVRDPRVAVYAERRRARILRNGPDPIDRALMDEGTRAALRATADRLNAEAGRPTRMPAITRTATIEAGPRYPRAA